MHLLFWIGYTAVYALLSASFAPKSVENDPFTSLFTWSWISELMFLPVKLVAFYGLLYWVVPNYLRHRKLATTLLVSIFGMAILSVIARLINYYWVYPFLYNEFPTYELISFKRLLYSFLDIFSAIGAAATVKLLSSKIEMKNKEEALQREKLTAELKYLKAQTNPHFLFNTLNNIYGLARRKSNETEHAVLKLSEILRFMLYECDKPQIALHQELIAIKNFIALEKLRYGNELIVTFNNQINNQTIQVAPLLLLPLVENAFKHGASESRFNSYINIDVGLNDNELYYRVENSIEHNESTHKAGIGLKNVQRQLELIYPKTHEFFVEKLDSSFIIEIRIQNIL